MRSTRLLFPVLLETLKRAIKSPLPRDENENGAFESQHRYEGSIVLEPTH